MKPSDLIIICALDLPIEQAFDLLSWYLFPEPEEVLQPSIDWWIENNAEALVEYARTKYKPWRGGTEPSERTTPY